MIALPIYGPARSGTTFLTELLLTSPECTVGPDVPYPYENRWLVYMAGILKLYSGRHPGADQLPPSPGLTSRTICVEMLIAGLRSMWGQLSIDFDRRFYVEKIHGFLDEVIPILPIQMTPIILIRDPREVLASHRVFLSKQGKDHSTYTMQSIWKTYRIFKNLKDAKVIQYTDMVAGKEIDLPVSVDYKLAVERSHAYKASHCTQADWRQILTPQDLDQYAELNWSPWWVES